MERFIATIILVFALAQAQLMFLTAWQISQVTNWQRLGHYVQERVATLYAEAQAGTSRAVPEADDNSGKKTRFVSLDTRGDNQEP